MINFDGKSITVEGFLYWDSVEDVLMLLEHDPKTTDSNLYGINLFNQLSSIFEKEVPGVCLRRSAEYLGTKEITIPDISMSAYFTDSERTREQAQTEFLTFLFEGEYAMSGRYVGYSEWTITDFNVDTCTLGGHDLITELRSYDGKYINMIIEI